MNDHDRHDEHHDDSLLDKAKRMFGMGDDDDRVSGSPTRTDAVDEMAGHAPGTSHADATGSGSLRGDRHGELAGQPHSADEGHFVDDPPLHEDPSAHPTTLDAGVSDAARGVRADDPLEDPGVRQHGFAETGAASGKVAMPGGEEPVATDEDWEDADRNRSIG